MNKYNTITRIRRLVNEHFDDDKYKVRLWFTTRNPMLGQVSPLTMISLGREDKLLRFIESALLENEREE